MLRLLLAWLLETLFRPPVVRSVSQAILKTTELRFQGWKQTNKVDFNLRSTLVMIEGDYFCTSLYIAYYEHSA